MLMFDCVEAGCILYDSHKVVFKEREDMPQNKLLVDHKPSMANSRGGMCVYSHVWFPS